MNDTDYELLKRQRDLLLDACKATLPVIAAAIASHVVHHGGSAPEFVAVERKVRAAIAIAD